MNKKKKKKYKPKNWVVYTIFYLEIIVSLIVLSIH